MKIVITGVPCFRRDTLSHRLRRELREYLRRLGVCVRVEIVYPDRVKPQGLGRPSYIGLLCSPRIARYRQDIVSGIIAVECSRESLKNWSHLHFGWYRGFYYEA
jgi:hypothetical protein